MPSSPIDDAEVQQIICQMKTQVLDDEDAATAKKSMSTPASMLSYLKDKDDRFANVTAMRFKRAFNKANSSLKCDDAPEKEESASKVSKASKRKSDNLAASHEHTAKMCSREFFEQNRALCLQLEKIETGVMNAERLGLLARQQALACKIALAHTADEKPPEEETVLTFSFLLLRH